ncbi:MAG TPA: hypothetical protein VL614_28250 [Acetobacteraceae bacterium]|jgi:hypothetical protein|nr:hypothetical protein [Acetobacteraceae bacterium]
MSELIPRQQCIRARLAAGIRHFADCFVSAPAGDAMARSSGALHPTAQKVGNVAFRLGA